MGNMKHKIENIFSRVSFQTENVVGVLFTFCRQRRKGSFSKYATSKKLGLKYYSAEGKGLRHFPSETFL